MQSLKPKLLELSVVLHRDNYDIVTLCETWLKPATPNRLLVVPDYQLFRTDRPDGRGYGGVALLARDGIRVTPLKVSADPKAHPNSKIETLWYLVKPDSKRQLIVGSIYRPPRDRVDDVRADFADLDAQYQRVLLDHPLAKVALTGDLNCDWFKPQSNCSKSCLFNFLSDYSFHQCVSSATFSSGSLLDIIAVNDPDLVKSCDAQFCHFSPHRFVRAFLSVPRFRTPPVVVCTRNWRRVDLTALLEDLSSSDWRSVVTSPTVTEKWECFLDIFIPIIDAHAPLRSLRIRNPNPPVVSDDTQVLMARRRAALAQFGHSSDLYKSLNRAVRSALRRDTRDDVLQRIQEGGQKAMWRCIRSVVASKKNSRITPDASADELNAFFVSVGPRVASEVSRQGKTPQLACRLPRVGACAFTLSPLTLDELRSIILGMNSTSSCGEDGITLQAVRLSFNAIGPIILHLVNASLTLSEIPDLWKHSLVSPIFKSGDHTKPSNYRPISIVPVVSKIVERAVHQQLYEYLSENHLLSPCQHGFRPRHSTETALTSITDHILSANDRGELSILCLLDLSKCFDVIDHSKLLSKLRAHGIDTSWFSDYLENHTQSVRLPDNQGNSNISTRLPNNIGVFQGSALGPLLYCIFANDLSLFVEDAVVVQYADDTQILISGPKSDFRNLIVRMERVLSSIDLWFRANGLKVNADKTQLMLFGSSQNIRDAPDFAVNFREHHLSPCLETKNLGLLFDQTLSWDAHVSLVVRRCFGVLSGLSHLKHCLPPSVIFVLVNGLVISQIRYCISVYGNGTQKNLTRLQKVINFAAKVIFGRKKYDRVSGLLSRLGWLSAGDLAKYHTLCLLHKIRHHGEPEELAASIVRVNETRDPDISTRQDDELFIPWSNTGMGERRFLCRAPLQYNALPPDLVHLPVSLFGRRLRHHLTPAQPD